MRLPVIIFVAAFLAAFSASAQTPEQHFQEGNTLYQKGNFAAAATAYETVLQNGYSSSDLFFNLGNAYYKQGNMGKAILSYERALRLSPGDDDVLHNLQLANLQIVDRIEPTPRLFIWDLWDGTKQAFSLARITWLTYLALVAVLGALTLVILARSYAMRKAGVIGALIGTVFLLLGVMVLVGKASDADRADEAVVVAALTTVKNSPDAKSSDAFVLHAGVKLRITDAINEWIRIRLADGKVGWIEQDAVEVI